MKGFQGSAPFVNERRDGGGNLASSACYLRCGNPGGE